MKRSFIVIVLPALLLTGFSIVFADNHGSGSGKLDIFSPTGASQDTLPGNTTLPVTNSLPEKYWAYDADADDRHAVVHHAHDEGADHRAHHLADPARHRRAADEHRRDHVQFERDPGLGRRRVQPRGEDVADQPAYTAPSCPCVCGQAVLRQPNRESRWIQSAWLLFA